MDNYVSTVASKPRKIGTVEKPRVEANMATTISTGLSEVRETHRVSITRLSVATGVSAAVIFVLCWIGTFVPFSSPTHAYIGLFTNADISSGVALYEGTCWSFVFGLIVGAVFALIYNATAPLGRR